MLNYRVRYKHILVGLVGRCCRTIMLGFEIFFSTLRYFVGNSVKSIAI